MRSHAEMRELAREVIYDREPRDMDEVALAYDVLDLLDELEERVSPAKTFEETVTEWHLILLKVTIVFYSLIVPLGMVAVAGKFVSWWLALGLWEALAAIYIGIYLPKWIGKRVKVIGVLLSAIYGPIMLVYEFVTVPALAKLNRAWQRREAAT